MDTELDYFHAIREVSKVFNSSLNREKVLELIVDKTIDLMDVKAVSFYLHDEDADKIVPLHQKGLSQKYINEGLTGPSRLLPYLQKDGYMFAYDASADERLDKLEAKAEEGITSLLVVPVVFYDKITGIISVYSKSPREFTQSEIDFVSALAEQAGIALEHLRIVNHLRMNNRILLDFTTSISSSLSLNKVMHILAAEIADFLEVKGSSILLFDEHQERLDFIIGYGLSEEYASRTRLIIEPSVAQTLEGQTVYIEDAKSDERVKYKESKKKEGIVTILSVPIVTDNRVLGALRLYSSKRRTYSEDEIMLIQSLAHIGGLAIKNASMYKKMKEDLSDLKEDIWSHRAWF